MTVIRVLVVDDSALIRQMLTRALSMDPRIEIVGVAKNGVEAIEKARELNPDVVTLDVEMPELSGLEALPHIRKYTNARVVMLSSAADADTTYRALSLGAVDFIPKPAAGLASSITELTDVLLKKIKTANRILPEHVLSVPAEQAMPPDRADSAPSAVGASGLAAVVAIAASTGGPPALERVFRGLTAKLPAAYVVVQHLPQGFSASLARRLSAAGGVRVSEAVHGELLAPGRGYIAPYGQHLTVVESARGPKLEFSDEPPQHGVKPAADVLFESVASSQGRRSVGVVLTGMGSDGARGALALKRAGGDVVAQDEDTSVVWGMPGTALRLGATNRSIPVDTIAPEIRRYVRLRAGGDGGE